MGTPVIKRVKYRRSEVPRQAFLARRGIFLIYFNRPIAQSMLFKRATALPVGIDPASKASERGRRPLLVGARAVPWLLRCPHTPRLHRRSRMLAWLCRWRSEDRALPVRARGLGALEHPPKAERTGPQIKSSATQAPIMDRPGLIPYSNYAIKEPVRGFAARGSGCGGQRTRDDAD